MSLPFSDTFISPKSRMKHIGARMKRLRRVFDFTQSEIADIIHIPTQTYAGYESGNHQPPIEILIRLSRFYNDSLEFLLAYDVMGE